MMLILFLLGLTLRGGGDIEGGEELIITDQDQDIGNSGGGITHRRVSADQSWGHVLFRFTDTFFSIGRENVNGLEGLDFGILLVFSCGLFGPCLLHRKGDGQIAGSDDFNGSSVQGVGRVIDVVHIDHTLLADELSKFIVHGLLTSGQVEESRFTGWNIIVRTSHDGRFFGSGRHFGRTETSVKHITVTIIAGGFLGGQSIAGARWHLGNEIGRPGGDAFCGFLLVRTSTNAFGGGFVLKQTNAVFVVGIVEALADQLMTEFGQRVLLFSDFFSFVDILVGVGCCCCSSTRRRRRLIRLLVLVLILHVEGCDRGGRRTELDFRGIVVVAHRLTTAQSNDLVFREGLTEESVEPQSVALDRVLYAKSLVQG